MIFIKIGATRVKVSAISAYTYIPGKKRIEFIIDSFKEFLDLSADEAEKVVEYLDEKFGL